MPEIVAHHTFFICFYKFFIVHHIIGHAVIRITYRTIIVHQMRKSFNCIIKTSIIFTYCEEIIPSSRHTEKPAVHIWPDPLETAAYKALDPFSIAHSPETIESLYVAFCISTTYYGRH